MNLKMDLLKKDFFKNLLIYQRIILIQFISILLIMTFFGIYLYTSNRSKEIKQLVLQTDQLKERLSSNLSIPLWNFDNDSCDRMFMQEIKDKYISAIVLNQNEKLFLGKIKSEKGDIVSIDDIKKYEGSLTKSYEIKKTKVIYKENNVDKEIGDLVLYVTDDYVRDKLTGLLIQTILQAIILVIALSIITFFILNLFLNKPLKEITNTAGRIANGENELKASVEGPTEIATMALAFNTMTTQLSSKAESFKKSNELLTEIISKAKDIILNLNSSSTEIEAAAQEQSAGAGEQASGVTEVSATLEELTITAKQITKNVGELVISSEEVARLLTESEKQLLDMVAHLDDVAAISAKNTSSIGELGKRSVIINEMVEMIKTIANKTDMLSINASIEAAKSKESGAGFSVIATEIRELSKETIDSAKKVENAAKDIQELLHTIIISSESESSKVIESGKVTKSVYGNVEKIVSQINDNYSFTQKIDVSIKQQEIGSRQAADTMKQMAEIARQSAETARQTSVAVMDIVNLGTELDKVVKKFD
ncbi:MAG: methyl-accepting chemotaxis protein [Spirochaetota bacterium]